MDLIILCGFLAGIAAVFCILIWQGNNRLVVSRYSIRSSKIEQPVRIVHLSDLHNKQFGKGNCELYRVIMEQMPDMIVFTGDLEDRRQNYNKATVDFLIGLAKNLPVFFVYGNQEMMGNFKKKLTADLKKGGVKVLDNQCDKVTVNGNRLSILGLNDYKLEYHEMFAVCRGKNLMKQFECSEHFKLLLTHYPHYFYHYKKNYHYCDYKMDLVMAGHAHGGLVRLPFLKGVIAPGQGLFPRYTAGIYNKKGVNMIVSRGLGNSGWPQRIFNPPEVVVVELAEA